MYVKLWKRVLDVILSLAALVLLSPILLILAMVGMVAMGGNPFFIQIRPGKNEKLFRLVKFRSMTNQKDKEGKLLPDEQRLTDYGRFIRSTSLDELPELWNILKGDMSIVGPRPQLVGDMVFMTPKQRRRHSVTPGLTGLAQVNGRNSITWEQKIAYDLAYIDSGITFWTDCSIILKTVEKVYNRVDTVREGETVSDLDYGDWLLQNGVITREIYENRQKEARELMRF